MDNAEATRIFLSEDLAPLPSLKVSLIGGSNVFWDNDPALWCDESCEYEQNAATDLQALTGSSHTGYERGKRKSCSERCSELGDCRVVFFLFRTSILLVVDSIPTISMSI